MKLFYSPGTISIAVALTLEEAGLSYEPVLVDFPNAQQTKPRYLSINPKGRVPALMLENGRVLTETGALLEYIAARAPEARLVPDDPVEAAHMRSVMYYLASTMHVAHAHKMRGHRWADNQESFADMRAKVPLNMTTSASFVESDCLRGDFVCGDAFSIADAYLFVVCNWLPGDGVETSAFPRVEAFQARMEERDSVKAIRAAAML